MPKKVKTSLITRTAEIRQDSFDEEAGTIDIVFTTGARVLRQPFWEEPFVEELSTKRNDVRLERMNSGGPFLNNHRTFSGLEAMLGSVAKGSAKMRSGEGVATIKLSQDPEKAGIIGDIKAGIITQISVGYRVHEFREIKKAKDGEPRVLRAVDWEPFEFSAVAIPADIGAGTRSEEMNQYESNDCNIILMREEDPMPPAEEKNTTTTQTQTEPTTRTEPEVPAATQTQTEPTTRTEPPANLSNTNAADILESARAFNIDMKVAEQYIREGKTVDQFRAHVQQVLAEGNSSTRTFAPIAMVDNMEREQQFRNDASLALLNRARPDKYKIEENHRPFAYRSMLDIGRMYLEMRGIKTTGWSNNQLADVLLNNKRSGAHTTSDFSLILEDVANKVLRMGYEEAPQTFEVFTRRTTATDFKDLNRYQFGEFTNLRKVLEHQEIKRKTMGEAKEKYFVETYADILAVSRKLIINDDMDALTRAPMEMGIAARDLESDLAWGQILTNPVMGDGNALFSAAHNNIGTGAIDVPNVGSGRSKMRRQTGLNGRRLNLAPAWLIVPTTLETVADQFTTTITPDEAGNVNPFAQGQSRLQSLAEPRLDDVSETQWYLSADKSRGDIVEMATLEGEDGPSITSRDGFDVEGVEIKVRHDVAAKVLDHRPLYRSSGV